MLDKSFDELCLIHFSLLSLHPAYKSSYNNYREAAWKLSKFKLVWMISKQYNFAKACKFID